MKTDRKYVGRSTVSAIVLGAALVLSNVSPGLAQEAEPATGISAAVDEGIPTNQIIIKYKEGAQISAAMAPDAPARMQTLSATAGIEIQYHRPMSGDAHVLRLPQRMPVQAVEEITRKLSTLAEVEYAEPDYIRRPMLTPNDPQYASQWHYYETYGLNLPAAWDIITGTANVVVAVIDTGYRPHADMAGRFVQGYDFIGLDLYNSTLQPLTANDGDGRDNDASDPGDWITSAESTSGFFQGCPVSNSSWHGTHVAGTIGANSNNSVGVAGVNWGAKILPVRVLGKCGGYDSDIADGMRWAAGLSVSGVPDNANPAKVLNLSLGGSGACPTAYQSAIHAINAAGRIVVVAAGNSNANASGFTPANCNGVITVGATDRTGLRAFYSNYGAVVDVSAPGGETSPTSSNGVLSTLNTGTQGPVADSYAYYQGTSMATPHVAGVVSLMATISPTLNYTRAEQILKTTVRAFGPGNDCATVGCGTGIVNARAALQALLAQLNRRAYLPVVYKAYPAPSSSIVNPGFESGPTGWIEYSAQGWPLILSSGFPSGVTPRSGSWAVWLGGADSETAYIQQQVTIPPSAPVLRYWYWIASQDICGYDFARVRVNGTAVQTYDLCSSNNTGGWVQGSVNLGSYAGQLVQLRFEVTTDSSLNSNFFLDDVSLAASLLMQSQAEPAPAELGNQPKPEAAPANPSPDAQPRAR